MLAAEGEVRVLRFRPTLGVLVMMIGVVALLACEHETRDYPLDVARLLPDAAADAFLDGGPAPADARPPERDAGDGGEDPGVDLGPAGEPVYRLTLLHVGNGASRVLRDDTVGGIARTVTAVRALRAAADEGPGRGTLTLSAGGEFAPGAPFAASLEDGPPFYDALALAAVGAQAIALGADSFEMGPGVLATFVASFAEPVPLLAANLVFVSEPLLSTLPAEGRLAATALFETGGARIGVVGAATGHLAQRAFAGGVIAHDAVTATQAAVDRLRSDGIDKIVLLAHLDDLEADLALLAALREVDVMISGGSSRLLAGPRDALLDGDRAVGPYPLIARDARGTTVPVVATAGGWRYVGRLVVDFDATGRVAAIDAAASGPMRVVGRPEEDASPADPAIASQIEAPVAAALERLARIQVARTEVTLDGRRASVRAAETNLGDLVADALRWAGRRFALGPGRATSVPEPEVAVIDAGSLRGDRLFRPGALSERDTLDLLPLGHNLVIVPGVTPATLERLLENALSRVETDGGRFPQVAGLKVRWDGQTTAQVTGLDGRVSVEGARVLRVELEDGTLIIDGGQPVTNQTLTLITTDFLASGGEQYPVVDAPIPIGVSVQGAVRDFLAGALEAQVTAARYPERGLGRLERVR